MDVAHIDVEGRLVEDSGVLRPGQSYVVRRGNENLTGLTVDQVEAECDVLGLRGYDLTAEELDAYRAAGHSCDVWVRPNGAWRHLVRALHALVGGELLVEEGVQDGLKPGVHRGQQLFA